MLRKKFIAILIAAVMIIAVPFTSMAQTIISVDDVQPISYNEIVTCPKTSKKTVDTFEAIFAKDFGVYQGEINVYFYNDSREVIFEGDYEMLPNPIRSDYKEWAKSNDYTRWLAGENGFEHIAAPINFYIYGKGEKRPNPPTAGEIAESIDNRNNMNNEGCVTCFQSYYIVNYYHYESEKSEKPSRTFQRRQGNCIICKQVITFDYLNEIALGEVSTTVINPYFIGVDLIDYTENEMYEFLRSHLLNTISSPFATESNINWAKQLLANLDNTRVLYVVDNTGNLFVRAYDKFWLSSNTIKIAMDLIITDIENRGRTIENTNFESLMAIYAK